MDKFKNNLDKVNSRIKAAADDSFRDFNDITLIAVSKGFGYEDILRFYNLGLRDFGESYIQEWNKKRLCLPNDINWHIIGTVQSNKTSLVASYASWVHSIDRLKIVRRLSDQRQFNKQPLNVCIEVNISEESNKQGVLIKDVLSLAYLINDLPNLRFRGLMCIASNSERYIINNQMERMKNLFLDLRDRGFNLDTLSMGMSFDLELAILNGSTCVRIGRDLFGLRSLKGYL